MKKLSHIFAVLLMAFSFQAFSQVIEEEVATEEQDSTVEQVIQVSGVIMTSDTLKQFVPSVAVAIKGRNGLIVRSGNDGFYSIAALPGDTIMFRHFSFQTQKLWVPDTLTGESYLSVVYLRWMSYELNTVVLYPWPTPENLNRELLAMQLPTTERDIAERNLAIQTLKERAAEMGYDAAEISSYVIKSQNYNLYNQGRYYGENGGAALLGRLTNPFAWNEFFQALKRGDFSN